MTNVEEIAAILFVNVAIVVLVARVFGGLFRRFRQPAVVGEIIAGILLGPTLLGALPGNLPERIFPLEVRPFLKVVAELGLILFMFVVGLELDLKLIRGKERTAAVISLTSVALPFGLGLVLAATLHGAHDMVGGQRVDFLPFALFIGAAMSVTAFPVLARILTERGMYKTPTGALTLACAAVDDILAWSLLAVVLAVVSASGLADLPIILGLSVAYVIAMFVVVRPVLERVAQRYRRTGRLTPDILAVVLGGILASSYVTAQIGIHAIFGAFLFGVVMPRRDTAGLFHAVLGRIEHFTVILLLPLFFVVTGLNVDVQGIGLGGVGSLLLILTVACVGKFVGASVAARLQGIPGRQAMAIGTLMNTRGLTELVILNVGRDFGVLDDELFTLLVVMAVVTTIIAEPVLRIVYPERIMRRDLAAVDQAAVGAPDTFTVLVAVGNLDHAPRLVDLAVDIAGDELPREIVLTRFVRLPGSGEIRSGLEAEAADQAATVEALRHAARHAEERGVPVVSLSQLSRDFSRDLARKAEAISAHVVVLGWSGTSLPEADREQFLKGVLRLAPCDVVVLVDPELEGVRADAARPIVVAAGEGYHNTAALELAVRVARNRAADVHVVDVEAAGEEARVVRSGRLAGLAEQVQRAGPFCVPHYAADGVVAEIVRQAAGSGLIAVGIDEDWYREGLFGPGTDQLLAATRCVTAVVRAREGVTRRGLGGIIERLQGRGLEDRHDIQARITAAGPAATYHADADIEEH